MNNDNDSGAGWEQHRRPNKGTIREHRRLRQPVRNLLRDLRKLPFVSLCPCHSPSVLPASCLFTRQRKQTILPRRIRRGNQVVYPPPLGRDSKECLPTYRLRQQGFGNREVFRHRLQQSRFQRRILAQSMMVRSVNQSEPQVNRPHTLVIVDMDRPPIEPVAMTIAAGCPGPAQTERNCSVWHAGGGTAEQQQRFLGKSADFQGGCKAEVPVGLVQWMGGLSALWHQEM